MPLTPLPTRSPPPQSAAVSPAEFRARVVAVMGASSGSLVEWFDFFIYVFGALYFAAAFFPSADPTGQLLATSGVLAAGFLMRPLGGWLFGRVGDRYGRKPAMLVSVALMGGGSLLIACLPTYASVGWWAPALLLLARLLQGLSLGGEFGTSATYLSELAPPGRLGLFSSFLYVTVIGGQLLAALTILLLQALLSDAELRAWGWRIPFLIGAVTAVAALSLRHGLPETSTAETRGAARIAGLRQLLRGHWRPFLMVLALASTGPTAFYTFSAYMQTFLVNSAGMTAPTATRIMTCALLAQMLMQPLFGALADRVGRNRCITAFGALATLATVPILLALQSASSVYAAFGLIVLAQGIVSLYTSVSGLVMAAMFPPQLRALGVSLPFAIGVALFAGTAQYAALYLKSIGLQQAFYWYVTVMAAIAFLVSLRLPKQPDYLHHHP